MKNRLMTAPLIAIASLVLTCTWAGIAIGQTDTVDPEPTGDCLSIENTCLVVPVNFNRTDVTEARGISVTFSLSVELRLCDDYGTSIVQGTWLDGFNSTFQAYENGGGSYTVDQAILGLPCGIDTGGELFTIEIAASGGDGTGTITVTDVRVRDCVNQPIPGVAGDPATIIIDTDPPVTIMDLSAIQEKTVNDDDGTTKINITFTAPGDAALIEVYRKGYGDYPEYDDGTGAAPTPPATPDDAVAEGWTLTGVTASGQADEPDTRDFWYYIVFTEDGCANVSVVSNMTDGTLNYHLGDVSDGFAGQGDNEVAGVDVSLLGTHYGINVSAPPNSDYNYLDVGPTTDYSVDALPTTDDLVEFEDLMMFAINYGQVFIIAGDVPSIDDSERPMLMLLTDHRTLRPGETVRAVLQLVGNESVVKGIHSVVSFEADGLELLDVAPGDLLAGQGGQVFFKTLDAPSGVTIDMAVMGSGETLFGSGDVAELTFRVQETVAMPTLSVADLRDRYNRCLSATPGEWDAAEMTEVISAALPTELRLVGARPNPFTAGTVIAFELPEALPVTVQIYDITGRLIRTLAERAFMAGRHALSWDGTTAAGQRAATGVYFYSFRAGAREEMQKLLFY